LIMIKIRNPFVIENKRSAKKVVRQLVTGKRRSYKAAQESDALYGWTSSPVSINSVLRTNLTKLRARSREQCKANDYAKRYLGLLKSNVIGSLGIVTSAKSKGVDGKPDILANQTINRHFKRWAKKRNCSLNGNLSWIDIQNQFISTIAEDGEILIREYTGRGEYNYQLQPLDPELLDVGFYSTLNNGNSIRMSIEFDSVGTAVAYWLLTNLSNDDVHVIAGRKYQRVPANEIMHEFLRERVGQIRGIPWVATPLARMKMLDGFEDAALINARAGATKTMIIETPQGESPNFEGDDDTSDAEDDEFIEELGSNVVEYLDPGQVAKPYDPTYPSNEFGTFNKAILRAISAGLNVSYNLLANDLEGVSFASGRIGVTEDREMWKALQTFTIEGLCERVVERWLSIQLATGKLIVPSKNGLQKALRLVDFDKFNDFFYRGKRWDYINPLQEWNANRVAYDLKAKSVSQMIRDAGGDPDEVFAEIEYERAIFKSLGFDVVSTKDKPDDEDIDEEAEDAKQQANDKGGK